MGFFDLFKPKWKHSDPEVRIEAIKKITETNILSTVVEYDSDDRVKQIALFQIAKNDKDWKARERAIKKITDQEIIIDIIKNEKNGKILLAAVNQLTNQELIVNIAKNSKNENSRVREIAIQKLKDMDVLMMIAKNEKDARYRSMAIKTIGEIGEASNVPILINALFDSDTNTRENARCALGKLDSKWFKLEAALAVIPKLESALTDKDIEQQCTAVLTLADMGYKGVKSELIRIIKNVKQITKKAESDVEAGKVFEGKDYHDVEREAMEMFPGRSELGRGDNQIGNSMIASFIDTAEKGQRLLNIYKPLLKAMELILKEKF